MRRRQFVGSLAAAVAASGALARSGAEAHACGCDGEAELGPLPEPPGSDALVVGLSAYFAVEPLRMQGVSRTSGAEPLTVKYCTSFAPSSNADSGSIARNKSR